MIFNGIGVVAQQEFRVRLRTGRWRWLLVAWVVVIAAFAGMLRLALHKVGSSGPIGLPLFGGLMLFVLALALLVAPSLTAQSINGDRERGTLATVQITQLSPAEIAIGKLAAAWGTALVFLVLTLPFVGWAIAEGGVGVIRAIIVLAIVGLLVGVICAVSQALSALFPRSITATLMSYLLVFALTVGTLITFALALVATTHTKQVTTRIPSETVREGEPVPSPEFHTYTTRESEPEYVWWLLAPNPFVVLADSAPEPPLRTDPDTGRVGPATDLDPLSALGYGVRQTRLDTSSGIRVGEPSPNGPAVWPYGLAFNMLLGGASVWITTRRLRTPVRRLGRGVRIA